MPRKKSFNQRIFENDLLIVEKAQEKILAMIEAQEVTAPALNSAIKDSAKRVLDFKQQIEDEGLIVEIISYQDCKADEKS